MCFKTSKHTKRNFDNLACWYAGKRRTVMRFEEISGVVVGNVQIK